MHGHFRAQTVGSLLLVLLFGACQSTPVLPLSEVRKVYVADPEGAPGEVAQSLNDALHDEAVRALRRRGYVVTTTMEEAQVVLSSRWEQDAEGRVKTVRPVLRLLDASGRSVFSAESAPALAPSFWTVPRVVHETDLLIARLPEVRPAP